MDALALLAAVRTANPTGRYARAADNTAIGEYVAHEKRFVARHERVGAAWWPMTSAGRWVDDSRPRPAVDWIE